MSLQQVIELDEPPLCANTSAMLEALVKRYTMPEWALVFNVADQVGFNAKRFADAIAMGMWKSRGYELHGIEVKVSRADWQKELKNGRKAEAVAAYCDRWWIAAPLGIVNKDELPGTWGLMELTKRGWRETVRPVKLDAKPADRLLIASLMRRAMERSDAEMQKRINVQREAEKAANERRIEEIVKRKTQDYEAARVKLDAMVAASGKELSEWDMTPDLGKALRLVRELMTSTYGSQLRLIADSAKRTEADVRALLTALDALQAKPEDIHIRNGKVAE